MGPTGEKYRTASPGAQAIGWRVTFVEICVAQTCPASMNGAYSSSSGKNGSRIRSSAFSSASRLPPPGMLRS
jgi:hypothetical protein